MANAGYLHPSPPLFLEHQFRNILVLQHLGHAYYSPYRERYGILRTKRSQVVLKRPNIISLWLCVCVSAVASWRVRRWMLGCGSVTQHNRPLFKIESTTSFSVALLDSLCYSPCPEAPPHTSLVGQGWQFWPIMN